MPTLQRCRSPDNGWEAFFVMKRQVKRLHDGKVQPCWGRGGGGGMGAIWESSSPRPPSHPPRQWMMGKALLQRFPGADSELGSGEAVRGQPRV